MTGKKQNAKEAAKKQQQQQQKQKQLTAEQQQVADAVDEAIRKEAESANQASSSSAQSSNKGKGPAKIPPAAATSTPNGTDPSLPSLGSDSEFVTITSSQEGSRIYMRYWDLCVWDAWPALVAARSRVESLPRHATHTRATHRPCCMGSPSGPCYHSV